MFVAMFDFDKLVVLICPTTEPSQPVFNIGEKCGHNGPQDMEFEELDVEHEVVLSRGLCCSQWARVCSMGRGFPTLSEVMNEQHQPTLRWHSTGLD